VAGNCRPEAPPQPLRAVARGPGALDTGAERTGGRGFLCGPGRRTERLRTWRPCDKPAHAAALAACQLGDPTPDGLVGLGRPRLPAQVVHPGRALEPLDPEVRLVDVLAHGPTACTVPAPEPAEFVDHRDELRRVLAGDAVLDGDDDRPRRRVNLDAGQVGLDVSVRIQGTKVRHRDWQPACGRKRHQCRHPSDRQRLARALGARQLAPPPAAERNAGERDGLVGRQHSPGHPARRGELHGDVEVGESQRPHGSPEHVGE
jgi:hypothetical protein